MSLRAGIIGYSVDTGLGVATRDFYRNLPFDSWLVIKHPKGGYAEEYLDERCVRASRWSDPRDVDTWLRGLDVVFGIEIGYVAGFWALARSRGVRTVLMPNAEWFRPRDLEMNCVDVFIAPTIDCYQMLIRQGFGARTYYIPHVIDTERMRFRMRDTAEVFGHFRGWDARGRRNSEVVKEAARRTPEVRFVIRSQGPHGTGWPPNATLLGPTARPEDQYGHADVAIQPSRWEGVGLNILEPMACGIPVLVPDAPPMNEYPSDPFLSVPADRATVFIGGRQWAAWDMRVADLVERIRVLHGRPIRELSLGARRQIETRSWDRLRPYYREALGLS